MIRHKSIAFSKITRAAYIDMAAVGTGGVNAQRPFAHTPVDDSLDRHLPWAKWGIDNLEPKRIYEDIATCGVLSGILDGKARFSVCNGILPALVHYEKDGTMAIDEILTAPEIDDFLEDNNHFLQTYGWMRDLFAFGNASVRFMLNRDRSAIAGFQRDDVTEMRYAKMDESGRIDNLYFSSCWDKVGTNVNDNRIIKVPYLHYNNPLNSLKDKVGSMPLNYEFAMTLKYPGWGKKYYSVQAWQAAYKWVKIAQGVPEMKAAMFENNFRPKFLVVISQEFWDNYFESLEAGKSSAEDYTADELSEKKNRVYDDIDKHLAGNLNAHKAVFVDGIMDRTTGKLSPLIDIQPIEDSTKAGELLPDSAAANSEIAFSLNWNPAINGGTMPSGPYTNSQGGSNVRESALLQVIVHELERRLIRSIFNVIKRFNGWDVKYGKEGLKMEFLIPATIPTTLDTGSNVKPIVTGANPVNDSKN